MTQLPPDMPDALVTALSHKTAGAHRPRRSLLHKIKSCFAQPFVDAGDIVKYELGHYLLELPPATDRIAILSPRYQDQAFPMQVVMHTADLYQWLHKNPLSCAHNTRQQAAAHALRFWLSHPQPEDTISHLPPIMYQMIHPYAPELIQQYALTTHCPHCQEEQPILIQEKDRGSACDWIWWTQSWHCPQGHPLLERKMEMRFYRKPGACQPDHPGEA